jgi:hypothetical protein
MYINIPLWAHVETQTSGTVDLQAKIYALNVSMVYISTLTHKIVLKQQGAIPVSLNSA